MANIFSDDTLEVKQAARRLVQTVINDFQKNTKEADPDKRELLTVIMLLSMFNPYLRDERIGVMKKMPEGFDQYTDAMIEMMKNPKKYMSSNSFWKSITSEVASDAVRLAVLEYVSDHADSFDYWNEFHEANEDDLLYMSQNDISLFKGRSKEMHMFMDDMVSKKRDYNVSSVKSRIAGKAGLTALGVGTGVLIASLVVAGTVVGSAVTCGAVAGAVLGVAAIAYIYYRYKRHKRFKKMDEAIRLQRERKSNYEGKAAKNLDEALKKAGLDETPVSQKNRQKPLKAINERDINHEDIMDRIGPVLNLVAGQPDGPSFN